MPITPTNKIWMDGELVDWADATVHVLTHTMHYGSGVFEGIRAYATPRGPAIFRLRDHMERFLRSAQVYSLAVPYDVDALCEATVETVRRNGVESAYIRPIAFFGEKTISLAPSFFCPTHVLIALRVLGDYFGAGQQNGIRVTLSPWRKFSSKALPSTVKATGHYANSVLAMQDAFARGFDEALLLNDRGDIAEGTGENVFVVKDGKVRTNDRSSDVLHGITRASVIELCADLQIPLEVDALSLDEIYAADEVFFTGTAAEVTPLACLDEQSGISSTPSGSLMSERSLRR